MFNQERCQQNGSASETYPKTGRSLDAVATTRQGNQAQLQSTSHCQATYSECSEQIPTRSDFNELLPGLWKGEQFDTVAGGKGTVSCDLRSSSIDTKSDDKSRSPLFINQKNRRLSAVNALSEYRHVNKVDNFGISRSLQDLRVPHSGGLRHACSSASLWRHEFREFKLSQSLPDEQDCSHGKNWMDECMSVVPVQNDGKITGSACPCALSRSGVINKERGSHNLLINCNATCIMDDKRRNPEELSATSISSSLEQSRNSSGSFIFPRKLIQTGMNSKQLTLLLILGFVDLLAAAVMSIQAPFYPEVASTKGASATEYGAVFGIFEFTSIIASPIFGSKMGTLGTRRIFITGVILTGAMSMVFGTLDVINTRWVFTSTCLFIRILEAIGESAYVTASFTIVAQEFPDQVATAFAVLETCYGFGMIVGPTIGGILYEVGGYSLPFAVMGGLLCTSAAITVYVFGNSGKTAVSEDETAIKATLFDMYRLLKVPLILVTAYGTVATATGVGFLGALLEPHLRQFGLRKVTVSFVFVLHGGVYALTAPLWGWLCDNWMNPLKVTLYGAMMSIVGFCLIGPLPFLPTSTILWLTCVGLTIFGLGMGAVYVSSFVIILKEAIGTKYPDDISTYGIVSGLWTCMVSTGYFIGPTLGGILEDNVGFRWGSLLVLSGLLILVICLFAIMTCSSRKNVKDEARDESNYS